MFLVVPLGFVKFAASQYDDPVVRASLGRLTHMVALIVSAAVIGVTFRQAVEFSRGISVQRKTAGARS